MTQTSQYSLQKQYIVEQAYRRMFQVGSMAQPAQWQAGEAFEIESALSLYLRSVVFFIFTVCVIEDFLCSKQLC